MALTQGGAANQQGKILERTVIPTFEGRGFEVVRYSAWCKKPQKYGLELLLKHVPYTTIYGQQGYTEFLVKSERFGLNTRIECKWQQSTGSVDEKFPYLYLNCVEAIPEDVIIIVGGGGAKPGAIAWLRDAVAQRKYLSSGAIAKSIQVFSLEEFLAWANRKLR
ncbi:MAG: PD-(D/E)XK nuclease superfamily protein [Cyanobacteria bacterium P01_A01_bin.135]